MKKKREKWVVVRDTPGGGGGEQNISNRVCIHFCGLTPQKETMFARSGRCEKPLLWDRYPYGDLLRCSAEPRDPTSALPYMPVTAQGLTVSI
jgi:hypothetical protein